MVSGSVIGLPKARVRFLYLSTFEILLSREVTLGIGCPRLYWVSSASCTKDMSVMSRGIFQVSLYSQQVEVNSLRKVIAIRPRRIEISMVDLDLALSGRLVGH